jgi:hypothetical protein
VESFPLSLADVRLCVWLMALALVFAALPSRSDDLGAELQDFAVRTWSKADGLPDGSVTVIQQTQDGYLWVGTAAGLVRFDGVKFTKVALPKGGLNKPVSITALCEDSSGFLVDWHRGSGHLFLEGRPASNTLGGAEGLLDENVTSLTWMRRAAVDRHQARRESTRRERICGLHDAGRFAGQFGFQRPRRQIGHRLDHHCRGHVPFRGWPDQPV